MNYTTIIQESEEALLAKEKRQTQGKYRVRVQLLRLLKIGHSLKEASALSGLSYRQSQRQIATYRKAGLGGMLHLNYTINAAKLQPEQIGQLKEVLKNSQTATQAQLQRYIEQEFGAHYSQGGISQLLVRQGIKLKTGHPSNVRGDAEQREVFKKILLKK
jgi:transposase